MENQKSDQKVIVFQLQDEEYALGVEQVASIERMLPITRVPQTADFVKGVINLRGVVIPVLDLRTRFNIKSSPYNESTRIIVVYFDGMEVGLIVDTANDVLDIPEDTMEDPPAVVGAVDVDYIKGIANLDHRLLILLDLQKVLKSDDMIELKSVQG
ncbi:purine-binding chemotaxis protein CheW [Virgibacillus halotolerans]|uniref:chemotaxis protein CheW n=1 Tax=Virgibacillus halotolerans TaxID=1071053 RepID=UPI00195F4280|nr:chemotaxis protein CheW [Virgibacillus halotolerans]MBM7598574.1 purine-binding chemotaxis protein CheW [Virgibacillus halotolerans]